MLYCEVTDTDQTVISAHQRSEQTFAFWANDRCSYCDSIRPEEFVRQIAEGQIQSGWEWLGDEPHYIATKAGRFYADHFLDTGEGWLRWHQTDIALATGVVFYWHDEHLRFRTFVDRGPIRHGEALRPAVVNRINAFLDALDRDESNLFGLI